MIKERRYTRIVCLELAISAPHLMMFKKSNHVRRVAFIAALGLGNK
jgi:hypothetical protein